MKYIVIMIACTLGLANAQAAEPASVPTCDAAYKGDRLKTWVCKMGASMCVEEQGAPDEAACNARLFTDAAYATKMRGRLVTMIHTDPGIRAIAIALELSK